tara:strand:- start:25 stop:201 length:177 start_codon:yes stop_codon:yes gene_type:complete
MIITNAKYIKFEGDTKNSAISATIDGTKCSIPISEGNKDYAEIIAQVSAGKITIEAAD